MEQGEQSFILTVTQFCGSIFFSFIDQYYHIPPYHERKGHSLPRIPQPYDNSKVATGGSSTVTCNGATIVQLRFGNRGCQRRLGLARHQ